METGDDVLTSKEGTKADVTSIANESRGASSRPHKSNRHVSFLDDEFLVEALEPEDPWKNAGNVTCTEVIVAYRGICSKTKAKPCEKLIKQLGACASFEDRVDVIDLRGFKLDNKGCEALEEIFRRVRTKTLDMENTNLEDDGFISILEMIEFYQVTCKLNVASNSRIKFRGWQVLSRTMRRTPCLEYLDLQNTIWTEQSIQFFGRSLRLDCPLVVLHMEGCNLSGRPLFLLASSVKFNHNLHDLFLGNNKLISSDGQCLGAMLKGNSALQLLDLRNNNLQDMGVGHVCEGLAEQDHGGLQTLVLWNNQLTHQGTGYVGKALTYTKTLQTLNLGHNRLTNEGIHMMKDGLIRNRTLQRLGLLSTKLTSEGFIALSEVLADSKSLLRLDVRENDPYVGGLMALSLSLKVNRTLVRIDLDKEFKKEPGMETTQRVLLADIYSYCQRNKTEHEEHRSMEQRSVSNSLVHDGVVHHGESAATSGEQLISGPPHLIQLQNPPDVQDELKTFTSDYPPNSRFTITRIDEDGRPSVQEPLVLIEDHFKHPDSSPLMNLQDPDSPSFVYFKDPDVSPFKEFENPVAPFGEFKNPASPLLVGSKDSDLASLKEFEVPNAPFGEFKNPASPLLGDSKDLVVSPLKEFEDPYAPFGELLVDSKDPDVSSFMECEDPDDLPLADFNASFEKVKDPDEIIREFKAPDAQQLVNFNVFVEQSSHHNAVDTVSNQLSTIPFLDTSPASDPELPSNIEHTLNTDGGDSSLVELLLPEPTNGLHTKESPQSSEDLEKELDAMLAAASDTKVAVNTHSGGSDEEFWTRQLDGFLNGTPQSSDTSTDLLS